MKLEKIFNELGITKVKLAEILGVSRQMVYNYLGEKDLYKIPKEKRFIILNLLGVKMPEEINNIIIDTDYMLEVDKRIDKIVSKSRILEKSTDEINKDIFIGLNSKQATVIQDVINTMKSQLMDQNNKEALNIYKYLNHFLQSVHTSPELKYILGYVSKAAGFIPHNENVFHEEEQFIFESILFSAMTLYNGGGTSKSRISETHRRFVRSIEQKNEEKLSRTMELNTVKTQALRELGYDEISKENASEVFAKIAEIESRKVNT